MYIYCYIKEWRQNPEWSLSCCLALILPLNDLQGEIRGLAGRNVLKQQLQSGKISMPSMSNSLKESGVVTFGLKEDDKELETEQRNPQNERNYRREKNERVICNCNLTDRESHNEHPGHENETSL